MVWAPDRPVRCQYGGGKSQPSPPPPVKMGDWTAFRFTLPNGSSAWHNGVVARIDVAPACWHINFEDATSRSYTSLKAVSDAAAVYSRRAATKRRKAGLAAGWIHLDAQLTRLKLVKRRAAPDGNCLIHATYRCLATTDDTSEFRHHAPTDVRTALHAFMVQNRHQIILSCGINGESDFDHQLQRVLHPVHSEPAAWLGDVHCRCLAAMLGRNIVVLNWFDSMRGVPVAKRPAAVFPADISWQSPNGFCVLDTFDDFCAWHNCGAAGDPTSWPAAYGPNGANLFLAFNGRDHYCAAVLSPAAALAATEELAASAAAMAAVASVSPAALPADARSPLAAVPPGPATSPQPRTSPSSGPPRHPLFQTPPATFPAGCPVPGCSISRSSGRGRLFDTQLKWLSHGRHHDRQEDSAALAANPASRPPASTTNANPGWRSGAPPSIHDTAFDAYADVDVGAALEHGLRPITWTPRKLLPGAASAFRTLLTKATANPGPLDPRACAGLALFATDVLANDSPHRGGARTANARHTGLQDRIRAAFNGAYLMLRSAATARASAAAAHAAAAATTHAAAFLRLPRRPPYASARTWRASGSRR